MYRPFKFLTRPFRGFRFVTLVPDRVLRFGDPMPWFMAFAYRDYGNRRTVFAAPPLNKLIAWTRQLCHWLYAPSWAKFDEAVRAELTEYLLRARRPLIPPSYHALDDLPGDDDAAPSAR